MKSYVILCRLENGQIKAHAYHYGAGDKWSSLVCYVERGRKKVFRLYSTSEKGKERFDRRMARRKNKDYEETPGELVERMMVQVKRLKDKYKHNDIFLSRVGSKTCPIKVDLRRDPKINKWNRNFIQKEV